MWFQCRTQHCLWCNENSRLRQQGKERVSMPHAALFVVQRDRHGASTCTFGRFNAARSIVCGATIGDRLRNGSSQRFQCRTQHCLWCNVFGEEHPDIILSFNAARSIVCGATNNVLQKHVWRFKFQCRTQHCLWCNQEAPESLIRSSIVSMPHAALFVVQQGDSS